VFWVLCFAAFRFGFLLYNRGLITDEVQTQEVLLSYWAGMPLDLSMTGYLIVIPILLATLCMGTAYETQFYTWLRRWHQVVLIPLVLICLSNLLVYGEWQTMLNQRALVYLRNPSGLFESLSLLHIIFAFLGVVIIQQLCIVLYKRIVESRTLDRSASIVGQIMGGMLTLGLSALMMRGTLDPMPISESAVYYSNHTILNHAATNPVWHFVHAITERRTTTNQYIATSTTSADALIEPLFVSKRDTTLLTTRTKPNVVIVMMESMTAQVLGTFGGEAGIATHLDGLAPDALLFDSIYATGYRTDQGISALLSGYPAQPDQSAVLLDDRMRGLPSLPSVFRKNGYRTMYYYGGGLHFANIGAYLRHLGFDQLVSEDDFSNQVMRQSWGVPDHLLMEYCADDLKRQKQPFFAFIQTLSLHLPYDTPGQTHPVEGPVSSRFRASATYADASIGGFLDQIRGESWFENTLFVFVADHGHSDPGHLGYDMPMARKVPLIIYGAVLPAHLQHTRNHQMGNHHDLPQTLIKGLALQMDKQDFRWSRDLLATYAHPFAMYCNETGFGWMTPPAQTGFHRFTDGYWYAPTGSMIDSTEQQRGRAYIQRMYDDFLELGNPD
jgi:phosphoglycerol transferase MdoB-like AlkP superfamily enzyme